MEKVLPTRMSIAMLKDQGAFSALPTYCILYVCIYLGPFSS